MVALSCWSLVTVLVLVVHLHSAVAGGGGAKSKTTSTIALYPRNVTSIIRDYGYPCEDHLAITSDGYFLSLQRIPRGIKSTLTTKKGVVLFQHGLTDNANGVVLNPPDEGLPFILAEAGYDVWLGNNRGNGYSMTNIKFTTEQDRFWDFTWDEMASIDLPTLINYILNKTGAKTLSYIGHSQGTIQAFAGFENAQVASKVDIFIALAPIAYLGHMKSWLGRVMGELDVAELLYLLGQREFDVSQAAKILIPDFCRYDPYPCDDVLEVLMGPSVNTNVTRMPYYLTYEPNPTSVKNMIHWVQAQDGTFQKYDYGEEGNLAHYGQRTPPQYSLANLPTSLPIALFTGGNDYLADPQDVEILLSKLVTPPVFIHNEPSYAHMDFIWAEDAHVKIYPKVLALLDKYSQ